MALFEAIVRRVEKLAIGLERSVRLTPGGGSVAVAQFEGESDEAVRAGARFHIQTSQATGIAPVQALPTTAAQWFLYNPLTSNTVMWFDCLGMWLLSGTAGAGGTVIFGLCALTNVPASVPTANATGVVLPNGNPASAKTSKLIVASGQTLAVNPGWAPLAFMNPAQTVLGQTQMEDQDLRGKIALSPGMGIALAVISPTGTTPLFAPYGSYREYQSDME